MNRKRVILAVLLGILVLSMTYAYLATPRLEKAPPRGDEARPSVAVDDAAEETGTVDRDRIDFSFLDVEPQEFPGAERNIFRFGQSRPVRTEVAKPVQPVVQQPVIAQPPPPVPIEVVEESLSQFTFLGFLEKGGEKTVFLSSSGELFLVNDGETFGVDKEFLVEDIDDETLHVRHRGRDRLIEVPLIEQQKLSTSVSAPRSIPRSAGIVEPPSQRQFAKPQRRGIRLAVPQPMGEPPGEGGAEVSPEELTADEFNPDGSSPDEYSPLEGQVFERPAERDVPEGEFNGTNQ